MTKADLIKLWQEATGLTGKQAGESLERLGDILAAELLAGGDVPIPRVGKLVVRTTAARAGRNPKTGEAIEIPAGKKIVLNVGGDLKSALKE